MNLNRRRFLQATTAGGLAAATGIRVSIAAEGWSELTAAPLDQTIGDGPASNLLGYNGAVPGPVLRFAQGRPVRIRFRNQLDQPTTVHWHGIRLANPMDGVPGLTQAPVLPGESFDYEFTPPDAGTFWYHAHFNSWDQVARGLFGALIIDEAEPPFAPENDHVLVLSDWRLGPDGRFDAASMRSQMDWSHAGRIGNLVTVNGAVAPEISVGAGGFQRLRIINTSTARVLRLSLPDSLILARDGQALPEIEPMPERFFLGPAQRLDLTISLEAGVNSVLTETSAEAFPLARFVAGRFARRSSLPLLALPDLPEPDLSDAVGVPLLMQGGALGTLNGVAVAEMHGMDMMASDAPLWAFNAVSGMGDTPLFRTPVGGTIRLDMVNDTAWDHAIHIHGHHFRVLARQGIEIDDGAWLDTVMIAPGERLSAAFVADNPGDWMIHCHMLEHSASGMDTWFRVA